MSPQPTTFSTCRTATGSLLAALSRDPESALGWLDRLHPALGDIPVDGALHWSGVCDDCSPWELSVAHQADRTDVRLLLEAQSSPSTAPGHAEAAHRLTGAIATLPGVSLEALQQLEGLFPMGNPDLPMAAYHGLDLSGTTPAAKIYLSPNAHPEGTAFVLRSAAQRLGRERAWEDFERRLGERRVHDINLVSLDLTAASRTRMKVYVRQRHADLRGLDDEYAALGRAPKGQLASVMRTLTGLDGDTYRGRPFFCVFHLGPDGLERMVVDIPFVGFVPNDAVARARLRRVFADLDLRPDAYEASLTALGPADLSTSLGLHSYASLQPGGAGARLTTYFSPCLFARTHGFEALRREHGWWSAA